MPETRNSTGKKNWVPAVAGMTMLALLIAGMWGTRILATEAADQDIAAAAGKLEAEGSTAEEGRFSGDESPSPISESGEAAPLEPDQGAEADSPDGDFDFFSDEPIADEELVVLPPEKSKWITVGGPIALFIFFLVQMFFYWWMVPFRGSNIGINLHEYPAGVQRGIAMALLLFGIAFCFGASEIWYQLRLHGSAEAYFAQMSLGKLIAFTHAHLFGFTTSFFIIGIPFSLQFNHLWQYQWIFPIGLAASLTDVISWWGIKYGAPSFEWISMFCGVAFSVSYLWMLIGLERVLLFPEVIWASDKDAQERMEQRRQLEEASRYQEGDL